MKIKWVKTFATPRQAFVAGSISEIEDEKGQKYVAAGLAVVDDEQIDLSVREVVKAEKPTEVKAEKVVEVKADKPRKDKK